MCGARPAATPRDANLGTLIAGGRGDLPLIQTACSTGAWRKSITRRAAAGTALPKAAARRPRAGPLRRRHLTVIHPLLTGRLVARALLARTDSGRCISVPYGARAWHAPATSRTPFLAVELPPYSPKRRNSIRWRTSGTISAATSIRKAFAFPIGTTCTPSITRFTAMSKTPAHCQRAGNSWRPAPVHHFIAIGPPPLRGNARRNMRRVAAARRSSLSWQQCECWRRWPKICRTERHEN